MKAQNVWGNTTDWTIHVQHLKNHFPHLKKWKFPRWVSLPEYETPQDGGGAGAATYICISFIHKTNKIVNKTFSRIPLTEMTIGYFISKCFPLGIDQYVKIISVVVSTAHDGKPQGVSVIFIFFYWLSHFFMYCQCFYTRVQRGMHINWRNSWTWNANMHECIIWLCMYI